MKNNYLSWAGFNFENLSFFINVKCMVFKNRLILYEGIEHLDFLLAILICPHLWFSYFLTEGCKGSGVVIYVTLGKLYASLLGIKPELAASSTVQARVDIDTEIIEVLFLIQQPYPIRTNIENWPYSKCTGRKLSSTR